MIRKSIYFLTLAVVMCFASCEKYDHAIADIEDRLDKIEGTSLTTIDQQLAAINGSIDDLKAVDAELDGYIKSLQATAADLQSQIDATNTALAALESDLEGQITASEQKVLNELTAVKTALEGELATINNTIATLQAKDEELEQKILDLKNYVDIEITSTEDWATATFSTLEQYEATQTAISQINALIKSTQESIAALEEKLSKNIADDIATAIAGVNADIAVKVTEITNGYTAAIATAKEDITEAYTDAIKTAITASETSMKEWVNGVLADGYYTKAEIDGKISALQTLLAEGDAVLQKEIDDLKVTLAKAESDLTAAYKKAIEDAINENNGTISAEIADAVKAAQDKLQAQIDAIDEKIETINQRLTALENNFANRIQSLTYIPTHTDGKATMTYNATSGKWEVEMSYFVTPKSIVGNIERKHISAKGVYTATTRAVNLIDLSVTAFESDADNGTITVTVSGNNLTNYLNGTSDAAVFLIISDGNNEFVSDYVPLAPANMSADDLKAAVSQALNDGVRDFTITGNLTEEQQRAIGTALNDWCHNYNGKLNNPDGQGTVTLTLPDVTAIADRAFRPNEEYGGDALKSITLPNVTVIGEYAFDGQSQLQSLIAPKVTEVKMKGLFNCRALTNVQMPDITTVGQSAFAWTGISTFPWDNLQFISRASFSQCTSISGVISLPKATSIDSDAFQGCSNLTEIIAPKVKTIGSSVFSYCPNLTELTFSTAIEYVGGQVLHNGSQPLYSQNITLTLVADQKELSGGDNTQYYSSWTVADGAATVEFGENKTFCGYTFKEIKKYGE